MDTPSGYIEREISHPLSNTLNAALRSLALERDESGHAGR
jgi:hypothetical protein